MKSMAHQKKCRAKMRKHEAFAVLMEQRTGKTKTVIDDASDRFLNEEIENLLVIAPNVVHIKWIEEEIPKHMTHDILYSAQFYKKRAKSKPWDFPYIDDHMRILS